jgi:hypothetical protein
MAVSFGVEEQGDLARSNGTHEILVAEDAARDTLADGRARVARPTGAGNGAVVEELLEGQQLSRSEGAAQDQCRQQHPHVPARAGRLCSGAPSHHHVTRKDRPEGKRLEGCAEMP